jgi:hypothetical protein
MMDSNSNKNIENNQINKSKYENWNKKKRNENSIKHNKKSTQQQYNQMFMERIFEKLINKMKK